MDAKTWLRTHYFVNRLMNYVGASEVIAVSVGPIGQSVHLTVNGFDAVCRGREVEQLVRGDHLHRYCLHGEFKVACVLDLPPMSKCVKPGERVEFDEPTVSIDGAHASLESGEVPLCDEAGDSEADTVLYADADKAIREQTVCGEGVTHG